MVKLKLCVVDKIGFKDICSFNQNHTYEKQNFIVSRVASRTWLMQ